MIGRVVRLSDGPFFCVVCFLVLSLCFQKSVLRNLKTDVRFASFSFENFRKSERKTKTQLESIEKIGYFRIKDRMFRIKRSDLFDAMQRCFQIRHRFRMTKR